MAHEADVNHTATDTGWSSLMLAARNEHAAVVRLLLAQGANVNQATITDGETALIIASLQGHVEVVHLLFLSHAALAPSTRLQHTLTQLEVCLPEEEAQGVSGLKAPSAPTQKEIDHHRFTHLPYRSWCQECVEAFAREWAHKAHADAREFPSFRVTTCM